MKLPPAPAPEEVLHDLQEGNTALLALPGDGREGFPLLQWIIEEEQVDYATDESTLTAAVTAYIGDVQWRSVDKKTIRMRYGLDEEGSAWRLSGMEIGESTVAVAARPASTPADASTAHRGG